MYNRMYWKFTIERPHVDPRPRTRHGFVLVSLSCFCASLIKLLGFLGGRKKKHNKRGGSKTSSSPPPFLISFWLFLISLINAEVESYRRWRWCYQEQNKYFTQRCFHACCLQPPQFLVKSRAAICFSCATFVRKHQWRKKKGEIMKSPSLSFHKWWFAPSLTFFQTTNKGPLRFLLYLLKPKQCTCGEEG